MFVRVIPVFAAVFLLALAAGAVGQEGEVKASATADESVKGELVRVDTQASTLAIQLEDGSEMEFRYDENTVVTGAQNSVEGLASQAGKAITVHFSPQDSGNLATRIEI